MGQIIVVHSFTAVNRDKTCPVRYVGTASPDGAPASYSTESRFWALLRMRITSNWKTLALIALGFALGTSAANAQVTSPGVTSPIKILAPKPGQKLTQSFVQVRFELTRNATASGSPTFQVQLDDRDPTRSTDNQQTFTGLAPGSHTVSIELIDANNTPVPGTRTEINFIVLPAPAPRTATPAPHLLLATAQQQPEKGESSSPEDLPRSGSPLPFLSAVGISSLVGGIYATVRTRHRRR